MEILIFHLLSSIIFLTFINYIGKMSVGSFGYVNISEIQKEANQGYNFIVRILSPAVFISFLSIILYVLKQDILIKNIWLISVYFWIVNFIILIALNRFTLVNKALYFLIIFLSITISYSVYELAIKRGLEFLLPEAGNFRTEIWYIIILFFYSLLNNIKPDAISEQEKETTFIKNKYAELKKKYSQYLKSEFKKNEVLNNTLFSLMIIEDINRPAFIRFIERVLSRMGLAHSTGIMQIKSKKDLNNKQSLSLAQEKILNKYYELDKNESVWTVVLEIAKDYNGSKYAKDIWKIYSKLT